MASNTLTLPTVHLNGTSKESLSEGYCNAYSAIAEAGRALAAAYPNARDYYPQGPHAIGKAMAEHESRMNKLREIMRDLEQIAESIPC